MVAVAEEKKGRAAQVIRLGEILPNDPQSERALVACMLVPEAGSDTVRRMLACGITAKTFFGVRERLVFEAGCALLMEGVNVDEIGIIMRLQQDEKLDRVGGVPEINEIGRQSVTTLHLPKLCAMVRDKERAREKLRSTWKLLDALQKGDTDTAAAAELEIAGAGPTATHKLPDILAWDQIVARKPVTPPELIEGVLHQGAKMMLGGGSKSFKTWCLLDMAMSVATGTPWWGLRTAKTRVLYVNFELAEWAFEERRKAICEAKKIAEAPGFSVWHLRGYAADLKVLLPYFLAQTAGGGFGLVVLDPIYKALGERDENANGDVASLLNEVESLAVRSGAAVVFGHHFSKGNQAAKEAKDRVSGAGAWARDPDTLVTLTSHEEEDCFVVDYVLRNQKPKKSQVIRWKPPCMEIDPGLNPSEIRQPGRPQAASIDDVVSLLGPDGSKYVQWEKAAKEKGISKGTFERRIKDAQEAGKVENVMHVWRRK